MSTPNLSPSYAQAAFKMQLVDLANRIGPTLSGDFREVRQLIDDAEMAFAVWQDPAEPDGVGFMTIKGKRHMREIIASNRPQDLTMTAIPCTCIKQAEALRRVVADSDGLH